MPVRPLLFEFAGRRTSPATSRASACRPMSKRIIVGAIGDAGGRRGTRVQFFRITRRFGLSGRFQERRLGFLHFLADGGRKRLFALLFSQSRRFLRDSPKRGISVFWRRNGLGALLVLPFGFLLLLRRASTR